MVYSALWIIWVLMVARLILFIGFVLIAGTLQKRTTGAFPDASDQCRELRGLLELGYRRRGTNRSSRRTAGSAKTSIRHLDAYEKD